LNSFKIAPGITGILFLFFIAIFSSANAEENSFGHRIFQIQKKQALKGNSLAQYKLGTFYEFGISVKSDENQAIEWYKKSARKKYKPAIDRLTYLEIKQQGYDEARHGQWFNNIRRQAQQGKSNAQIILGQMYHRGIIVQRDLKKAAELLQLASSKGHTEVDNEINEINSLINSKEQKQQHKVTDSTKKKKLTAKAEKRSSTPKKPAKKKTAKKKPAKKDRRKKQLSEKERKYRAAMEKLRQENLLLQQTQEWAEEGDESE